VTSRLVRWPRACWDVAQAARAVVLARRTVRDLPVGALVHRMPPAAPAPAGRLSDGQRLTGQRWGAAVDRALRLLPGDGACLIRATALRSLLVQRGLPAAAVRIGVRRGAAGFEAHAWVECDGIAIAESDRVRGQFAPLDGVTVARTTSSEHGG
jgi:hypothetical protein